ncbi:DUF397 domain-containing protein [Streptomyces sp. JJ66]|uniref:DUF397 domain-containing protein n=1 Tax=Streptomyces sp. JJ66 TaxID=2803843 RepID=UPI001C582EBD|nr:DUF397 domain-containing protein [Streptomyces sp. JJ66]MBW1603951.1 DUF397 domain-containing protein [Streptomyces sp. JJ66]
MAIRQGRTTHWVKSSYSGGNGACVEVKSPAERTVAVRDSKNPLGPSIAFAPGSWTSFLSAVDAGGLGQS